MEDRVGRSTTYVMLLAVAACAILIGGWLARPSEVPDSPAPLPSETELQQLARRAERRSLESMSGFFAGVARDVEGTLAHVRGADISAVSWDDTHVLAGPLSRLRRAQTVTVSAPGGDVEANPVVSGPNLPFTLLQTTRAPQGLSLPVPAPTLPSTGDWIVAVWRTGSGVPFAAATFSQIESIMCEHLPLRQVMSSAPLTRAMIGGGLYDMDGGLLAVILPCDGRVVAVESASLRNVVTRAATPEQQLMGRFGMGVVDVQADARAGTGAGVLVREVWSGSVAEESGLWAGDVISAVGEQPVTGVNTLAVRLADADPATPITLQRGKTSLTRTLGPAAPPGPDAHAAAGVVLEAPAGGYRIEDVQPGSRAARAGLEPGDRIVRIDRVEPKSPEQVRRILAAPPRAALLIEVERGPRRLALFVPPDPS